MSIIHCPHCGQEIRVQAELPLGPIALRPKKKLDVETGVQVKIEPTRFPISAARQSPARFDSNRLDKPNRIGPLGEDLAESIRTAVGENEWKRNGRLWRWYAKNHFVVTGIAIRDWLALDPTERAKKENPAAWLMGNIKRQLEKSA